MTTTYTWDCKTVDVYPTNQEETDVVYNVHWIVTGTSDELDPQGVAYSSGSIGTQTLSVDDARNKMSAIQNELGSLPIRKAALIKAFADQEAEAQAVSDAIREEYGDGMVDLETGEFTANEDEDES